MNTRLTALNILLQYEKEGMKLDPLLLDVLQRYKVTEGRDRAFITRLTEGVVERLISLDYVIDQAASVKSSKMKRPVRMIIRLGAYQLLFMDRVPESAAVNESVKLAKLMGFGGLKGFVNGVLRGIAGLKERGIDWPDVKTECSFPDWIEERFRTDHGAEASERMMRAGIGRMPLYLRVNRCRMEPGELIRGLGERGITVEETGIDPYTLRVTEGELVPAEDESFLEGLYSVQDLSSQMAVCRLWENIEVYIKNKNIVDISVLDLCAAPGGKSCFLAELFGGLKDERLKFHITSCDISEQKLEKIRENIRRTGIRGIETTVRDAAAFDQDLVSTVDVIIADLPCSGLGVTGRKVDIKYRVKPGDVMALCELQRRILDNAVRYLKSGGILMFSVCTVTREETFGQADYIEKLGLHKIEERQLLQGIDGCDGFYYAVFEKRG